MDSQILSVSGVCDWTEASSADSMASFLERRYVLRSNSTAADCCRDVVVDFLVEWECVKVGVMELGVKAEVVVDVRRRRARLDKRTIVLMLLFMMKVMIY